jgi:hypothetical protein
MKFDLKRHNLMVKITLFSAALLLSPLAQAGKADVLKVRVKCTDRCSFSVTVKHADQGWDHYANEWQVVALDGRILGTRTLYHPHVDEQPFTRSLSGVSIPSSIHSVTVRARDTVHGYGGREQRVELPPH